MTLADAKPDSYEAADPEEYSRNTVEPRAELNSGEISESFAIADVEDTGENLEEESERHDDNSEGMSKVVEVPSLTRILES